MNRLAGRAIDANFNRASEGLRVIEDYARFVLEDRILSSRCKTIRHQLAESLSGLISDAIRFRDTPGDVGTSVQTEQEYQRNDLRSVAKSSCKRVQQALRCIEEFSKLYSDAMPIAIERLRYESYQLELAIIEVGLGRNALENIRLCVLVDCGKSATSFTNQIDRLAACDVRMFQLRDKNADDRLLIERFAILRDRTQKTNSILIVNDRSDLAKLLKADGVHLGQDDLTVGESRRILNTDQLVGVSTHTIDQARQAVLDGANYIGIGPVFPSPTKSFGSFPGPEFVIQVAQEIGLPAFAIGGINSDNVEDIVQNGVHRIAVSGAVWKNEHAQDEVQKLKKALDGDKHPRRNGELKDEL